MILCRVVGSFENPGGGKGVGGSSDVVGVICPPVEKGLIDLSKSILPHETILTRNRIIVHRRRLMVHTVLL